MQADSITSAAARAITGLTAQGLRDAVERGELQAERLSPRVLVYSRRDVETWAARRAGHRRRPRGRAPRRRARRRPQGRRSRVGRGWPVVLVPRPPQARRFLRGGPAHARRPVTLHERIAAARQAAAECQLRDEADEAARAARRGPAKRSSSDRVARAITVEAFREAARRTR